MSVARKERQGPVAAAFHTRGMERDLRLLMYEKELRRLLLDLRDHDYLIFEGISVDDTGKQYYLDINVA